MTGAGSVADVRAAARRRVPRMVFDYADGGAEDEVTMRANRRAFEDVTFVPRIPSGPSDPAAPDLATSVAGHPIALPVILGPCGALRMFHPEGERAAARAAEGRGTVSVLSTMAGFTIDEVADAIGDGRLWYQLYGAGGRGVMGAAIDRAAARGVQAMVVTVDSPTPGLRERDLRSGAISVLQGGRSGLARAAAQFAAHPSWLYRFARAGFPTDCPNVKADGLVLDLRGAHTVLSSLGSSALTWETIAWVRSRWPGPLLVKGIVGPEEACRARDEGATGIVVSNHGGRQLDGLPSTLSRLPRVVEAVGRSLEVLVDSGFRRGSDVVKALCLGATAVLVGRPYVWGLAAGGQGGVERVVDIFADEIRRVLVLLGCPSVAGLGDHYVEVPEAWRARTPSLP